MAVILGRRIHKGKEILFLLDPHRYRATVWGWDGSAKILLRVMVDKDEVRLHKRVIEWIDKCAQTGL